MIEPRANRPHPPRPVVKPLAASAPHGWDADERASGGVLDELRRLLLRAAARPWLTLALTLLATATVVGYRARKQQVFESRIAFRVVEGDVDPATGPSPNGRLREYVADICFSTSRLLSVIRARGLYPGLTKRDPSLAVEEMRDDLNIEVWRNYFIEGAAGPDGREARVAISYQGHDPRQVYDVVRDLGALVTEAEATSRQDEADSALIAADDEVADAKAVLEKAQAALVAKQFLRASAKSTAETAQLLVQAIDLEQGMPKLERQLEAAQKRRTRIYMRSQIERKQLGLRFELTDQGRVASAGVSRHKLLAFVAVAMFFFSLPLAMIAVGAFDDRIYRTVDVQRLGLRALGAMRPFVGDNVGALDIRLQQDSRGRGGDGGSGSGRNSGGSVGNGGGGSAGNGGGSVGQRAGGSAEHGGGSVGNGGAKRGVSVGAPDNGRAAGGSDAAADSTAVEGDDGRGVISSDGGNRASSAESGVGAKSTGGIGTGEPPVDGGRSTKTGGKASSKRRKGKSDDAK